MVAAARNESKLGTGAVDVVAGDVRAHITAVRVSLILTAMTLFSLLC